MAQIDEMHKNSIEKIARIRALGWNPYVSKFDKQHTIAEALSSEGKEVQTAGKITSLRTHGNITFSDLKDASGEIQIFFKKDSLSADAYKNLKLLDVGDIIGVKGTVGKTSTGEISIIPVEYTLLTKSMLPLPNEWYGIKDVEIRHRKRYLDLQLNPHVKDIFLTRSKIITLLRKYLDEHNFLEVETPILQPIYGGAYAKPFVSHYNALDADFYLRIAVELYLKRLLVGGFEKVYELSKNFRNEGFSRAHNPEFTMLEFYWAYADYQDLIKFTEEMLTSVISEVNGSLSVESEGITYDFTSPWERKTYRELFIEYLKLDINEYADEASLLKIVLEKKLLDKKVVGYGQMLDELYKKHVRPHLKGPLFVTEYPLEIKALAKASEADPTKSASFQLVINGMELINAYNELNDPIDQKERWEEELKLAERGGEDYQVLDEDYIEALSYGMPPTAGWGMGIDRLVAFLTGQHSIKETILFPTVRPEKSYIVDTTEKVPVQQTQPLQSAMLLKISREIIDLGSDMAASEFFKNGEYTMKKENKTFLASELSAYYVDLIESFNILSFEDPFAEDDWNSFASFTKQAGSNHIIVGDDLFVTDLDRIQKGIAENTANAVLIKLNQIGTLFETVQAISATKKAGWKTVISHRSGETEDSFIADLSVACASDFIKTGSMSRSDRLAKYNRLLEIEAREYTK